jgi:hypothetical protein
MAPYRKRALERRKHIHFVNFVRIIKVSEVRSFNGVSAAVNARYPDARMTLGEEPRTVLIVVPDLLWNSSPNGPEGFFRGLCQSGMIGGFRHKRYSDQEEVRY